MERKITIEDYEKGTISIKTYCNLTNKTFHETLLLLEKKGIEPPITQVMDEYTSAIRKKLTTKDIFKEGVKTTRESPIIDE